METHPHHYETIDRQIERFLEEHSFDDRWLMIQSFLMAESRRAILDALPIASASRILDIGTGFGTLPLEIGSRWQVEIDGLDSDAAKVEIAQKLKDRVEGAFDMPGTVRFTHGDAYRLPYGAGSFDLVVAWHVYQHLRHPDLATKEIFRVLSPGGFVCLIDADDQLVLTYPDPLPERELLTEAFHKLQTGRGGDRFVGRKLSTYLQNAGFENINTVVRMETQHGQYRTTDANHRLLLEHFALEREAIISSGFMSEQVFSECMQVLSEPKSLGYRFTSNGLFVALASRPASHRSSSRGLPPEEGGTRLR